jgi:DNA-binding NtrC family response regulator
MHPGVAVPATSIVASSAAMLSVLTNVVRLARSPDPVVIVGETGSGKSTIARLLHELSGRPGRLAEISVGELDSPLAQDDLFGHSRGAYTGAVGERRGLFAEADGGTLLLDDFHLLKRSRQYVLLRVLDRQEFRRLGSDRSVPTHARVVVGVHEGLDDLMRRGRLLPDLRWRLGMLEVRVPNLEERIDDIAPLATRFLEEYRAELGGVGPVKLHPQTVAVLELLPWPGNVRQLKAMVRRAVLHASESDELFPAHLGVDAYSLLLFNPNASVDQKKRLVQWALWRSDGEVGRAARLIKAHRNTVSTLRARFPARAAREEQEAT